MGVCMCVCEGVCAGVSRYECITHSVCLGLRGVDIDTGEGRANALQSLDNAL